MDHQHMACKEEPREMDLGCGLIDERLMMRPVVELYRIGM